MFFINPLTLQINNTSFHEGLFYKHQNDIVSDVLVGVIHICRENKNVVKSLLWFLIPCKDKGSKRKNMATNLQRLDAYVAMLDYLREERNKTLSTFLVGFKDIACKTENEPWHNPIHTMETRLTRGIHSLPCSVVNCVRYILKCISSINIDQEKSSFVDKQEMVREMVQDEFCKETVEMLHRAIETKILDVQTDENIAYEDDVQRIKNLKMKLFTDIEVRKDLIRFLTFAHSLEE